MPEVIDAFGHQIQGWPIALIVVVPLAIAFVFCTVWFARMESLDHAEALERIQRRDTHSNPNDVSGGGDDWHVGRVVRAEKP